MKIFPASTLTLLAALLGLSFALPSDARAQEAGPPQESDMPEEPIKPAQPGIGADAPEPSPDDEPAPPAVNPPALDPAAPAPKDNPKTSRLNPSTSLLRVNVTAQSYNARLPWQKLSPASRTALGALVSGNRVLTTAQLVSDATFIEIEKPDSGQKVISEVVAVDYEANLAIVAPKSPQPEFFAGLVPLPLDESVRTGDLLKIWQVNTEGGSVITPVRFAEASTGFYFLESSFFLIFKTSGLIQFHSGTSSVPAVKNGRLVGLMLAYSARDQIATLLPAPIIAHFLKDLEDGSYAGFPSHGIRYSQTRDDQFREYLGLTGNDGGVFISAVSPGGSAEAAGLKEGDVLLGINSNAIDARGNYTDPVFGRLNLSHLVKGGAYVGDPVTMDILRGGERKRLTGKLIRENPEDHLIDPYMFDRGPRFLLMGGLLFQELTLPYLKTFGNEWPKEAPFRLVFANGNQKQYKEEGRNKLVILSGVIPSQSVLGYERLASLIVTEVNGKQIKDIKDLDAAFSTPDADGIHTVEFTDYPKKIFLSDELVRKDNAEFMPNYYRIPLQKRLE